jgi:hypothetical protein
MSLVMLNQIFVLLSFYATDTALKFFTRMSMLLANCLESPHSFGLLLAAPTQIAKFCEFANNINAGHTPRRAGAKMTSRICGWCIITESSR